jgi:hypothetical protein
MRRIIQALRLVDRALEFVVFDLLFAPRWRGYVLGAAGFAGAMLLVLSSPEAPERPAVEPETQASSLLTDRPWLDHLPKDEYDAYRAVIFQKKGAGAFLKATAYRGRWELCVYRDKDKRLELYFPHDKKHFATGYTISKTKHGTFDLELTLEEAPFGPKTYYSWKSFRHEDLGAQPLSSLALERWLLPASSGIE